MVLFVPVCNSLLHPFSALTKLREELEGRKRKLCRGCKKFEHLVCNYRNRKEKERGVATPQNQFEVLSSRVMQCGVEERVIRSMRIAVRCFKCREEGHKCRKCPLWQK